MPPRHSKKENSYVVVPPTAESFPAMTPSRRKPLAAPAPTPAPPPTPAPTLLAVPPVPVATDKTDENPKSLSEQQRARINAFMRSLPDQAEAGLELAWVRNHPAMLRRGESSKGSGYIEITIEDLKRPHHGPAPSKSAVQMLKHHAQNPLKFFELDLVAQVKRASAEEGTNDAEELEFIDDLREVDRMIRDATKTTRRKDKSQPTTTG
jgi:hypothetical protein